MPPPSYLRAASAPLLQGLVFSFLLVGAATGQVRMTDATLEDLVRAADGRIGICARNLSTNESLSLNGVRPFYAQGLKALITGVRALELLLATGQDPSARATALYESTDPPSLRPSFAALVQDSLKSAEHESLDRLVRWLGGAGLASSLPPLPASTPRRQDLRQWLRPLDSRFDSVDDERLARWFDRRDASALVPQTFDVDPRLQPDFMRRIGDSRIAHQREPAQSATPEAVVNFLSKAVGDSALRTALTSVLHAGASPSLGNRLPIHLHTCAADGGGVAARSTAGFVETDKGIIVVVAFAEGYWSDQVADDLLSVLANGAVRRQAPGAIRKLELDAAQGTPFRHVFLTTAEVAARSSTADPKRPLEMDAAPADHQNYRLGDEVHLVIAVDGTKVRAVHVRWVGSDDRPVVVRYGVSGDGWQVVDARFTPKDPGSYEVHLGAPGRVEGSRKFQVFPPRSPK